MNKYRKIATVFLVFLFCFSTGKYLLQLHNNSIADESYSHAVALASASAPAQTVPETLSAPSEKEETAQALYLPAAVEGDPHLEELRKLDLNALQQINPDVIGWIHLPDTSINYPIVQGQDNEQYLETTWDGTKNPSGSIFLEMLNKQDMTEFHTILYGHNMINNTMFAPIREFHTLEHWQKHPYVYLFTETGVLRYEIYAAYQADVEADTYKVGMQQDRTKQKFIDFTLEQSVIDTGIMPAVTDRILTLSTCSGMGYSTRWVVHARLPMAKVPA